MSTIRFIAEPPDLAELIGYRTDHPADLFRVDDIRPIAFALRNRRGGAGLLRSGSMMLVLRACFKLRTRLEADSLQSISASHRRT
jgi:hypothetical protein